MEIDDTDVDVIGDFNLASNLLQLNKFKDEWKFKKEKRVGLKRNRCYSVFEPYEEVVKISKIDGDQNEDMSVDVEGDEDSDYESVKTFHSQESTEENKQEEKRKLRNGCLKSENNFKKDTELHISELHFLILCAIGLGDGAIKLSYNEQGRISKVDVYKSRKTCRKTLNCANKANFKGVNLETSDEKRIYCKYFDSINSAPFRIKFRLEALILAECHAHGAENTANAGLFLGFYDNDEHTLHVTDAVPFGVVGEFTYEEFNQEIIVGWYFAFPLTTTESYAINVPIHNDLKNLFTNNASDPFIMLAISPFNRIKTRCVTTVDNSPYVIDYEVYFYKDIKLEKALNGIWYGLSQSTSYVGVHLQNISKYNRKTFGQLCYESIRRLLDSTTNLICNDIKDKLMVKAKEVILQS